MPKTQSRATPRAYSARGQLAAIELSPELRDHPRAGEYVAYASLIRFPKAFANWLEDTEAREAGKSKSGARLQRMMDQQMSCADPLKVRIHR
jgi:hypothetical protein